MSPFRYRRALRLGPVTVHFTQNGYSSTSIKLGPWSYNTRARAQRVDLPGGAHWQGRRRGGAR